MSEASAQSERSRGIQRVLFVTLILNLLVAAAKAVFGFISGSLAIATDAIHSLVDASSNLVGFVATRIAASPPDEDHPYGHRKIEIVAAAAIGVAIAITAFRFAWTAIDALVEGRPALQPSAVGIAVILGTWAVNVFVAIYESRRARELDSQFLSADAAHTASDVFVTAIVLAAYGAGHFGYHWADPVGALVVVAVIAYVAWRILISNLSVLVDQAVLDADQIKEVALSVEHVRGCHRVRSRGTRDSAHVDLHLLLDPQISLERAHEIAHCVEDAIRAELPAVMDVVVHMEPDGDGHEDL